MTEIALTKRGNMLVVVDDIAADELARIPNDKGVLVTIRVPRNIRHHRLAWALAQKLAENCDHLHDREDAMDYLKIKARHVKMMIDPRTGRLHMVPKSISFAALDQVGFNKLFDRFITVICEDILPGIDADALRAEVLAMVDGRDLRKAEAA